MRPGEVYNLGGDVQYEVKFVCAGDGRGQGYGLNNNGSLKVCDGVTWN